jgi:hypothetical protein
LTLFGGERLLTGFGLENQSIVKFPVDFVTKIDKESDITSIAVVAWG